MMTKLLFLPLVSILFWACTNQVESNYSDAARETKEAVEGEMEAVESQLGEMEQEQAD